MTATPSWRARGRALGRLLRPWLREPLVQFVLLGGLLFLLWAAVRPAAPEADADLAAAGGGVGAPARTVKLGPTELALLESSFRAAWRRAPEPAELADLVETFLGEEILFREGAALGLDRDDAMVRRRLIEKAAALARPAAPAGEPTREELRRWYATYRHRFRRPASLTVEQLYFDARKRGDAEAAARQALERLGGQGPERPVPEGVGDSFVLPTRLEERGETQLAHLFGEGFVAGLRTAPLGAWHGPVRSTYGPHLVRVLARQPERVPPFEEMEKHVRAYWLTVENRGQRAAALNLLPRYRITIDPTVRRKLEGAAPLAPFLERAR